MNSAKTATALILLSLLAAGCASPRNDETPFYPGERQGDVSLYRDIQFEDIPVPANFLLVNGKSYSFQGARLRIGMFYYEGPLGWRETSDFYRDQMPLGGWRREAGENGFDYELMKFSKGPEQAVVVVRALPRGSRVEIQIDDAAKNDLLLRGKIKGTP